jgi:hypothetical protein
VKKRKFKPGPPLKTLNQVWVANEKCQWLWLFGRPKHPTVLVSMTVRTVASFLRAGALRKAVKV